MTSPKRLIETTEEPLERALLEAGCVVSASPKLRANVIEQLGLQPAEQAAPVVRLPKRTRWVALAGIAVSTLAAAMPIVYWSMTTPTRVPAAVGVRDSGRRPMTSGATENVTLPKLVTPVELPMSEARVEAEAPREAQSAKSGRASSAKPANSDRLAAELAALDAVRQKMHSGDAKSALSALDAYQRDFLKPHLALEADALRIFALDESGQKEVARRQAESFIARHPKGVLSARVRRYLEQQPQK